MKTQNPAEGGVGSEEASCQDSITLSQPPQENKAFAVLTNLRRAYPVFAETKPLAIGVRDALETIRTDIETQRLSAALRIHTQGAWYQEALAEGGARYTLDGTPCGEVTARQQDYAKRKLARLKTPVPPKAPAEPKEPSVQCQRVNDLRPMLSLKRKVS